MDQTRERKTDLKVHGKVSNKLLSRRYGRCSTIVFESNKYIEIHEHGKGIIYYTILKDMPSIEEYQEIQNNYYTLKVSDAIEEACSEIECLKDGLQEWYDNLPENFQSGDKGQELEEAIDKLDQAHSSIYSIDFDTQGNREYGELKIVQLPATGYSRSCVCTRVIDMLSKVINLTEGSSFNSELKEAVSELEDVSFPGMY